MAAYNEILLWFSDIFNVNIVSSRQLFYKSNCSLIFFPVILSHNFQNRNSMKTRDICTKICILCPGFLAYQDIYEKNVYYIPCVCHNRTFLPSSRPYVPFDFYKRTFLSSFCLYVLCRCHSRTFLPPFRPYIPSDLRCGIFFVLFPLYIPSGSSCSFFTRNRDVSQMEIGIFADSNLYKQKRTYHEIAVSPLPSETRGIRTPDNLIKSQVLYQLS